MPWRTVFITAIISFSMAIIGIYAVNTAKNFQIQSLTANNIAAEGLDALQSIRNVNWIKYREDPKKCWMNLPQTNICSSENKIKAGYYALKKTMDINQWELVYIGSTPQTALDLNTENQVNADFLFNSRQAVAPKDAPDPTDYFRMIEIKYESDEEVTVISTVRWKTFFGVQTSRPATTLTNYINVEND